MSAANWPGSAELAGGEQAQRPGSPDSAEAVHGNRADGIVNAEVLEKFDAVDYDDAGDGAEQNRAGGADPVAGAGDGDQSGQEAVDGETHVPLLTHEVGHEHGGETGGAGGQRGVGGDAPDAFKVHGGKGGAGVESVPAEPQNQTAGAGDGEIVRHHWSTAVAFEAAAQARAENDGAGQGDECRRWCEPRSNPRSHGSWCRATAGRSRRRPWWRGSHPDPRPSGR